MATFVSTAPNPPEVDSRDNSTQSASVDTSGALLDNTENSSSKLETLHPQYSRSKYTSPPPPSSSMTPPPSSQPVRRISGSPTLLESQEQRSIIARTPTPTASHLSSPPPTLTQTNRTGRLDDQGQDLIGAKKERTSDPSYADLQMENTQLEAMIRDARMSAAHYKLQHHLLTIETEEATKRMDVEHEMLRKEVEVMGEHSQSRRDLGTPSTTKSAVDQPSPNQMRINHELRQHCQEIEYENMNLKKKLHRAKKVIIQREGELTNLLEENSRLRKRIKDNREHVNRLRGFYHSQPGNIHAAPLIQHRSTPKSSGRVRTSQVSTSRSGGESTFAALLLADQVLSQKNNSAPSTPTKSRAPKQAYQGHSRGSISLSSLPAVSLSQSRPSTATSVSLLPPVTFDSSPTSRVSSQQAQHPQQVEIPSRESTISASDHEPDSNETDEEVDESPASQLTTHMLRRSPMSRGEVIPPGNSKDGQLSQSKIYGKVSKPSVAGSKRKDDRAHDDSQKRNRTEGIIGLGIGGWEGSLK